MPDLPNGVTIGGGVALPAGTYKPLRALADGVYTLVYALPAGQIDAWTLNTFPALMINGNPLLFNGNKVGMTDG